MSNVARITRSQVGTATVVRLDGEHDLATSPELVEAMAEATLPQARVVVDLSGATFIDSTVLRAITAGAKESDAFAIVAPQGTPPRRLLDLTGLTGVYAVAEDLDAALERVGVREPARG
jgi:anti-sigma B factor antagonist